MRPRRSWCLCVFVIASWLGHSRATWAQTAAPSADQNGMAQMSGNAMAMMTGPLDISDTRDGSGTAWLPDDSPMHAVMHQAGPWMLMLHGVAFVQYIATSSDRGDHQFGSVNWVMGMARRNVGEGSLTGRVMLSLEPLTVGRCGYPDLLQTGEVCSGAQLHDRQHPHDLFMEIAADYRRALSSSVALELYGGPAGEPALGPVAYPHRPSAQPDLVAPISHHWLDSTHVSFGVVTAALYGRVWKAEASVFNGREPDDQRYDIDLAPLDSYSGRVWLLPSPRWAFQFSAGHLKEAEIHPDAPREDVNRITGSGTYHRLKGSQLWATTVAWGRNCETQVCTSAFLAETAVDLSMRDRWFGRAEVVGKTAQDLALPLSASDVFTVGKIRGGYSRVVAAGRGISVSLGASVGLAFVPSSISPYYGRRSPAEAAVFLSVRPQ